MPAPGFEPLAFPGTSRFRVTRVLGEGGMGVVYEAFDTEQGARVALKTLRAASPAAILGFKNEFRALQDLAHPNLVRLGELGTGGGQWFFTMELVDGVDLLAHVNGGGDAGEPSTREVAAPTVEPALAPPGTRYDEARLRAALVQLARGLCALHGARKVHRDVKPSNVMVTAEGRVVLLDFGLIADQAAPAAAVGTLAYMAPEQAAADPVGPPADWYAVGVMLYQILTGRLPITGSLAEVLERKRQPVLRSPHALVPDVPADLDALCRDLLRVEPAARPSGAEVLLRLGASASAPAPRQAFVGRQAELGALGAALRDARREGRALVVHGESGVGKTALVRTFIGTLPAGAVVLAGRCYERETVPYKAFDEVVDALSRHLAGLPEAELVPLLPRHAALLAQVFPVLRALAGVAAPGPADETSSPQELRLRVFAALRELLRRLADRVPLIIVIDDLQWSDADSDLLLAEIMRAPDAPNLLLLATSRTAPGPRVGLSLAGLALARLPPEDALELVRRLQAGSPGSERLDPAAVAEEADGHPLFISELVRHAESGRSAPLALDEAIWAHLGALDAAARALMEVVAVAGGPIAQATTAAAAAMGVAELGRHVSVLRAGQLVRTAGAGAGDAIEPYHDRIREAVLVRLDGDRRKECHAGLARALAANENAEPELLAMHWAKAGAPVQAAEHALRAADKASRVLAFDRAARLYRLALELDPPSADRAIDLQVKLGDVLVHAGRGHDGAQAYLHAAALAPAMAALELRRRAAEQLIVSGHVDEGLAALDGVRRGLGIRAPRSRAGVLLSLLYRRTLIRLRGLRFRARDEAATPAADIARMNVFETAGRSLSILDSLGAAESQSRLLLLALRCGVPARVAQAVALEAVHSSIVGGSAARRTERLVRAAQALSEEVGRPYYLAAAAVAAGSSDICGAGRWRAGLAHLERSLEITEGLSGVTYERVSQQVLYFFAIYFLGDLATMAARVPVLVREADERGDRFAGASLRTMLHNTAWLVAGDPAEARHQIEEARRLWGNQRYGFPPLWGLLAEAHIDLYQGRGMAALDALRRDWKPLVRSLVLHVQIARIIAFDLRARAALAAHDATPSGSLLAEAGRFTKKIERERMAWADPLALMLRAGLACRRGVVARACELLDRAAERFDSLEMALHAAVARGYRGTLLGGDEGRGLTRACHAWLTGQGVREPERMAAMLAPGIGGRGP